MCVCREYLKLFFNSAAILRARKSVIFEDFNINPLCFALSLQELLFKQQFFHSFVWKSVIVNGVTFHVENGKVNYEGRPVFQKGCCRLWSSYKKY
uniref:4b protein n=1 Tax=Infectious bronchitis virus TaxID=11120 RepID=A0A0D3MDA0_9GAMC|nr:4b protein [Infectious bronchitis virus]QKG30369.1 4b accessory peptide [Infectious bronchitis virus]QLI34460.1 4b accessory peptide [Infectious bronchitis virus]QLI34496.1 4b accessory peptide [Infectious bronchitis virus]